MFKFSFAIAFVFISASAVLYAEAKGRSHGYPSSHGLSGGGHSSGHGHKTGGPHSYPHSPGHSGTSHGSSSPNIHYHYKPPQHISYHHGGTSVNYPVFVGTPPTYVYEYRDSGSVYGSLLAGLALYNLGVNSAANRHHNYNPQPDGKCMFGIKKSNGDYEETIIKCEIITSFIFEEQPKVTTNSSFTSTSFSNVTTMEVTNGQPNMSSTAVTVNVNYVMAPNGTMIPEVTSQNVTNNNGTITSMRESVTVTTNTTTVTDALAVKGKEIQVTPEMECFVIRRAPNTYMKKHVQCGLLQTYAEKSLHGNSASRHVPTITLFAAVFTLVALR